MADHKLLIPFILRWEGGWADDHLDMGGATMKGITFATFTSYRKSKGLPVPARDDLRNISDGEWGEIFKKLYWDRWRGDGILNQSLANILVDWVWGSGVHGIMIPQRLLGVAADGAVGPKTIAALNAADPHTFFAGIRKARLDFVDNIVKNKPEQIRFLKGWKNRINAIKYEE